MRPYDKQALTFDEQLDLLTKRGLTVNDRDTAIAALSHISYYRLSAYWYPFRIRDDDNNVTDELVAGTGFEDVLMLYDFDRQLRLLIMDAIERVEVSIRTNLTYVIAHQFGAFGHRDEKNMHLEFKHSWWLSRLDNEAGKSKEEFTRHYKRSYHGSPRIPIWMATEIISFGSLSMLYKGLGNEEKRKVAEPYSLHYKTLADWLHVLTYIRNTCAHHSRLWNRELSIRPHFQGLQDDWKPPKTPRNDRIYIIILMLNHLLKESGNGTDWREAVTQLVEPIVTSERWMKAMGFPEKWKEHPLW